MNSRVRISGVLLGIIALIVCTILMWDVSRFLGVVLLIATIAMVGMYVAVLIESKTNSIYPEDDEDY